MNKTLKKIIIVLVVLVIIGIGASFFAGDKTSNQNPLQSIVSGGTGAILTQNATTNQNFANTEEINREFIATLLNLQAIKLNDDIFSQPAFTVLVDNSVRLNQPGNHGRPNPFAPIGLDPVASPETLDMQASVSSASSTETTLSDTIIEPSDIPEAPQTEATGGEIPADILLEGS